MLSLFQLSTRSYDSEIPKVREAVAALEEKCNAKGGCRIGPPVNKAGWSFFELELSVEMTETIETTGMMEGAQGYTISEQLKNFVGHFLESYGSRVRIKKIDYD
ncbi:MAG: hypothetical protein EB150_02815 [Nitrososphaeria archaeon]|nr:hypothetical protein [Nitrososphaeria archaeon]NDB52204.1 hypothetical protein [Nitrosopumilaceae archaeon]NDF25439.1 hypothetical protein [Nitrososphaerota archaeon]NDB47214.1 hypothetical protein [Nitrososphaeria archaeon]NDB63811.1 hypothetical protein [Nitrosopumilaceae archaeon]